MLSVKIRRPIGSQCFYCWRRARRKLWAPSLEEAAVPPLKKSNDSHKNHLTFLQIRGIL